MKKKKKSRVKLQLKFIVNKNKYKVIHKKIKPKTENYLFFVQNMEKKKKKRNKIKPKFPWKKKKLPISTMMSPGRALIRIFFFFLRKLLICPFWAEYITNKLCWSFHGCIQVHPSPVLPCSKKQHQVWAWFSKCQPSLYSQHFQSHGSVSTRQITQQADR